MKKPKKKSKCFKRLFILLFIAIFITLYSFSNKMLIDLGVSSYSGVLSTASYYALDKSLGNNYDFNSLFTIHKDDKGEIQMITTDAFTFNKLSTIIVDNVTIFLNDYLSKGVEVPIGVFSGIRILSGFGKKIKMPLITVNSVKCDVVSKFEEAGINQTKHSIYVNIIPEVYVVTRLSTKRLTDSITVLMYENVIIGKVPETYLLGSVFSSQKSV